MSGEGGGSWIENITKWGSRAFHLADPYVKTAAKAAKLGKGATGALGKAVPIIGGVLSGGSALYNGYEAVNNFSKGGYHCDKAWNNVGGAILGGAGVGIAAAGAAGAPYGAALAATEIGLDAGGAAAGWGFGKKAAFSADNVVGGLARGMYGDRSIGENVSNALGGGFWGHAAGTATNVVASPLNLLKTVGGGIAGEIGAIGSGILHGEGAVGGAIHSVGSGISSLAHGAASLLPSGW